MHGQQQLPIITYTEVMWKPYGMAHIVGSDKPRKVLCGSNGSARGQSPDCWRVPEPHDHRCRKCIKLLSDKGGRLG